MMCEGCKTLADESRRRQKNPNGSNRHINHLRKTKPHCDQPVTCTCQHRRIQDYDFVKKESS